MSPRTEMPRHRAGMKTAFALALAALLGGCMMVPMGMMMMDDGETRSAHGSHGAGGHAAEMPRGTAGFETEAERVSVERCASPLAVAIVTEDAVETPQALRDRQARVGVPALARTARRLAEASGCFRVLDADPLLFSLPGSVQPDLLLRVRFVDIELVERSGFEHAWHAARRRAGRYLGDQHAQPETLRAAEIGLALVCARERRVARSFAGKNDGTPDPEGADVAKGNQERVALAYARALNTALAFLRSTDKPCG